MSESIQPESCLHGCHTPVPSELLESRLCVLHFILSTERTCAGMRRETAAEMANERRQAEIADYVKATAMKLSEVAIGNHHLSDEIKMRILTAFLTLMNLRESLGRSASRNVSELLAKTAAAVPGPSPQLVRLRA